MFRFISVLVIFLLAGWCWLAFNDDGNLLYAAGGAILGLFGFWVLFTPIFRRRVADESDDN